MVTTRSGRTYVTASAPARRRAPTVRVPRSLVVPGFTRVGGNYGPARAARAYPGQELKFYDVVCDDAAMTPAGIIFQGMNTIAQGTGEQQRIGRKCTLKSIAWRYRLEYNNATVNTAINARLMVVQDTQANGAYPSVTDVLEADDYQSFNNLANMGRFRTLHDKVITLNRTASRDTGATVEFSENAMNGTFFKTCNIPLEFSSTTGAITEIRSNNLFIILMGPVHALINGNLRLRFTG